MPSNTLLLMDGTGLAYRAFFAIRALATRAGRPTNAVYGFIRMVRQLEAAWQPTHWAVVFDGGTPPARLNLLPTYKAQRVAMPDALRGQFAPIEAFLQAARIPAVRLLAEEADDAMASLTARARDRDAEVLLATSDKDLFQLVSEHVAIVPPTAGGEKMGPAQVRVRTGVNPDRIVEWLALTGDAADNIPGVPGIGPKTAAQLLAQYGSLDGLWARLEKLPARKTRQALTDHRAVVERNLALIRLRTDLIEQLDWDTLRRQPADAAALRRTFTELEFHALVRELEDSPAPGAAVRGKAAAQMDLF
ncbi:MAG: hypothetical protein NTV49_12420 [Kiritimatiellaeota bacterium]|nr:hypothetical protein [Kiritimatiellota bacterium]